jgi:nucleoside-diphosphate-sugar epimerase
MLHTILGAGGAIGNNLLDLLTQNGEQVRLVSRKYRPAENAESVEANVLDKSDLAEALRGSGVVYLLVGIDYSGSSWEIHWPVIMENVISVCADQQIPLIFFDNIYMYGLVEGEITESTPFQPNSRKGKVRANIASMLLDAVQSGKIKALIARSAEFYGPHSAQVSFLHQLVIGRHMHGKKAQWMVNHSQKAIKDQLDLASKLIFQTADPKHVLFLRDLPLQLAIRQGEKQSDKLLWRGLLETIIMLTIPHPINAMFYRSLLYQQSALMDEMQSKINEQSGRTMCVTHVNK